MARNCVCLAVLPFDDLSSEEDKAYFARGFAEDLITELSRFPTLAVISSHSATALSTRDVPERAAMDLEIDYLLYGSLRYSSDRIRINTRLTEPHRDSVLWAERYDAASGSLFDIQDDIISRVVASLSSRIELSRLADARRKAPADLVAYDCWLRGMDHLRRGTLEHDKEARKLFSRVLEAEPESARAFAGLSLSYANEWSCQLWECWEENERQAFEHASRAAELDESDHVIQLILGRIFLYRRDFDRAEQYLDRAYQLNPNDADNLVQLSLAKTQLGSPEEGVALHEQALRLNPYCESWYYAYGAFPHFLLGDYSKALEIGCRAPPALMVDLPAYKGAACAFLGRFEEAQRYIQDFRESFREKIAGGRLVSDAEMHDWVLSVNPLRRPEHVEHLTEGLKTAGLDSPRLVPSRRAAPMEDEGLFHAERKVRHIRFAGLETQLPEVRGFADIEILLRRPGEEISSSELHGVPSDVTVSDVLDSRARSEYRTRIEALRVQIEEARERRDDDLEARLREEFELIAEQLAGATGLRGRSRKLGATGERARSAVTQRIRAAISRIGEAHEELGRHFSQSIQTGGACRYSADRPLRWRF